MGVGVGVARGDAVGVGVGEEVDRGVTDGVGVGEAFDPWSFGFVEPPPVELVDGDFEAPPIVATATAGAFVAGTRKRSPITMAPSAVATRSRETRKRRSRFPIGNNLGHEGYERGRTGTTSPFPDRNEIRNSGVSQMRAGSVVRRDLPRNYFRIVKLGRGFKLRGIYRLFMRAAFGIRDGR